VLLLFTPGAPREEYFEKLGQIAEQERAAFLDKHDSYFVEQACGALRLTPAR
jgi:hypothetical protein